MTNALTSRVTSFRFSAWQFQWRLVCHDAWWFLRDFRPIPISESFSIDPLHPSVSCGWPKGIPNWEVQDLRLLTRVTQFLRRPVFNFIDILRAAFAPTFLRQKIKKPNFRTKKLLVKCWWNWHLWRCWLTANQDWGWRRRWRGSLLLWWWALT